MAGVSGRSGPPANQNAVGSRGGAAPIGNSNGVSHGAYSMMRTGRWPAHAIEAGLPIDLEALGEQLRKSVFDAHGEVSLQSAALIQSIERHEGAARLFLLYLEQNPTLPVEVRMNILKNLSAATDKRDASIKALGLDQQSSGKTPHPFAFLSTTTT